MKKQHQHKNNKHSFTKTRSQGSTKITSTSRRDCGISATIVTTGNKKGTEFVVCLEDETTLYFNGREARTLYALLARHYNS
jgi:hypothetical protein